ncbi:MAG: hypothetical protein WCC17_11235 [Candidatus Nitrosopolaris sp.]
MMLQTFCGSKKNSMIMRLMIIITSRKDDHDVTNTISQTSLAASSLIVDLEIHNIEGIGLTIAGKRRFHDGYCSSQCRRSLLLI